MAKSMTAFARQEANHDFGGLVWELRSVNHRFKEVSVRLPEELRALEPTVRERVGSQLSRGKIDCTLRFKPASHAPAGVNVNERLANQVIEAANQINGLLHGSVPPTAMDVLRWPGVLEAEAQDFGPVQQAAADLLDQALDTLNSARQREGQALTELIGQRCRAMREQVEIARERIPTVIEQVRERLRSRLAEVAGELDPARVEQEMVVLTQRLDVDEEMDRLRTHLDEVERVIRKSEPIGRRLDFLMQELNREANTLGSKSVDTVTTGVSVEMKVLIEQMREQIQNIE